MARVERDVRICGAPWNDWARDLFVLGGGERLCKLAYATGHRLSTDYSDQPLALSPKGKRACARLQDDEVVAVDELGLGDVAEDRFDLARGLAQDARRFARRVVHEAARDL